MVFPSVGLNSSLNPLILFKQSLIASIFWPNAFTSNCVVDTVTKSVNVCWIKLTCCCIFPKFPLFTEFINPFSTVFPSLSVVLNLAPTNSLILSIAVLMLFIWAMNPWLSSPILNCVLAISDKDANASFIEPILSLKPPKSTLLIDFTFFVSKPLIVSIAVFKSFNWDTIKSVSNCVPATSDKEEIVSFTASTCSFNFVYFCLEIFLAVPAIPLSSLPLLINGCNAFCKISIFSLNESKFETPFNFSFNWLILSTDVINPWTAVEMPW